MTSLRINIPLTAILALFCALLVAFPVRAERLEGVAIVIDGDTIELNGTRIRLHGIDAPEARQECMISGAVWSCGADATRALSNAMRDNQTACEGVKRDRYRRLIAVCYVGKTDVNAEMVRNGWALAYRRYAMDYVADESAARAAGRGIWRSRFVEPWEWRYARR
ncbi:MAG: thermonuclease family protein [Rhodospirillales bacterium]|nr:thermonuclease family protein [Rhodospirillales bacterium]